MANTFPIQHNVIDSDQYRQLSLAAKVLYTTLCKLSNRYGNKNQDNWFDRSMRELMNDTNLTNKPITRARKELVTAYMIQVITEPDYTKHISNKYRIIPWKKVRFKRNNYRSKSHSNYRNNSHILNTNTYTKKVTLKSKLIT